MEATLQLPLVWADDEVEDPADDGEHDDGGDEDDDDNESLLEYLFCSIIICMAQLRSIWDELSADVEFLRPLKSDIGDEILVCRSAVLFGSLELLVFDTEDDAGLLKELPECLFNLLASLVRFSTSTVSDSSLLASSALTFGRPKRSSLGIRRSSSGESSLLSMYCELTCFDA